MDDGYVGFFFSSRRRHTRSDRDWSSDVCSSDLNASIDIFERIESLEKRKPGTVAKVFATHPMTADRIRMAQKNINEILPNKPEYVVNTSEFNETRGRVIAAHQRQKRQADDPAKPTLRQAPSRGKPVDGQANNGDDRPTLQRHLADAEL